MAKTGRPPRFNNCLDLAWAIEDYFERCDDGRPRLVKDKQGRQHTEVMPVPYTKCGLQAHLRLTDGSWIEDYSARSEQFYHVIKDAIRRIEVQRNEQLLTGEANTIGSIFLLKACHGYRDTPEQAQSGGITVIIDGAGSYRLGGQEQVPDAIDCDFQTVTVQLPQGAGAEAE